MSNTKTVYWRNWLCCAFCLGLGLWWYSWQSRPLTPEQEIERVLRDIQNIRGSSGPDLIALGEAMARLNVAREKLKIREERESEIPISKREEQLRLIMAENEHGMTSEAREKYRAALSEFSRLPIIVSAPSSSGATEKVARAESQPLHPRERKCGYCGGLGWYVCRGCFGSGRNRPTPPPSYTGDPVADAMIGLKYDDTCPSCQGQQKVTCLKCRGTGTLRL
jgi:hypothetical protein